MRRFLLSFAVFLLTPVLALAQTQADETRAETPVIRIFRAEILTQKDSSIDVTESILYDFGTEASHGIVRTTPLTYGVGLDEVRLPFRVKSVTDEVGNPVVYEDYSYDGIDLKIGDPDVTITGAQWYVISYHVDAVINGFEDYDELYWNVTGNEWDVPIERAEAVVHLPSEGDRARQRVACYTGIIDSTESACTVEPNNTNSFTVTTTDALDLYEGLTIVAGFEQGHVQLPATLIITSRDPEVIEITLDDEAHSAFTPTTFRLSAGTHRVNAEEFLYQPFARSVTLAAGTTRSEDIMLEKKPWVGFARIQLPFLLLVGGSLGLGALWWKRGRDPKGRGTIVPQYEPPRNMTPGEMGVVLDESVHMHDISASIIHLAVRGFLKIRKEQKDYTLIKTAEMRDDVPKFEQKIFSALFKNGVEVQLTESHANFAAQLDDIEDAVYALVVDNGYFPKNPLRVKMKYNGYASLVLILGGILFIGMGATFKSPWYVLTWGVVSVLCYLVASRMPRRSKLGAEVHEEILGFKKFLTLTEKERLKFFNSPRRYGESFETYLPYAMVLGVEKEWAREFQGVYTHAPRWYEGDDAANALLFSQSMRTFNRTAQRTLAAPHSSGGRGRSSHTRASRGGSGFGGGGFSGGGFGGGGGGRW